MKLKRFLNEAAFGQQPEHEVFKSFNPKELKTVEEVLRRFDATDVNVALKKSFKNNIREFIPILVDNGADINAKGLLKDALKSDDIRLIKAFIDAGGNPNIGRPIHSALFTVGQSERKFEIVKFLIDAGTEITDSDRKIVFDSIKNFQQPQSFEQQEKLDRLKKTLNLLEPKAADDEEINEITSAPQDYLMRHHIPLAYKSLRNKGAQIVRNKQTGEWIGVNMDTSLKANKRNHDLSLWHEIGHQIDDAKFMGTRQIGAYATSGKFSTNGQSVLDAHRDFILRNRHSQDMIVDFKYKSAAGIKRYKFKGIEEIKANTEIPPQARDMLIYKTKMYLYKFNNYEGQTIELFAHGYAIYKVDPQLMKTEAPKLYEFFNRIDMSVNEAGQYLRKRVHGFRGMGREISSTKQLTNEVNYFTTSIEQAIDFAGEAGWILEAKLKINRPFYTEDEREVTTKPYDDDFIEKLKKEGYDGIIAQGSYEGYVVVFAKSQIKMIASYPASAAKSLR